MKAMSEEDPRRARRTFILDDREAVLIRPIEPADSIDQLTSLLHRAYRGLAEMGFRFYASHQTSEQTAKRIAGAHCWVAVMSSKLVGTVCLSDDRRKWDSRCAYYHRAGVWTCNQFAVEPELRRRGIGAAMMDLVEQAAAASGAAEIALDTAEGAAHLIRYYERRGYRVVGHVQWNITNYRSVVMSKWLQGGS
jgi:GNAT superfamily N-acetyltransferase